MADWKLSPGGWCHIDVVATDRARAQKFCGDVFGSTFEDLGEGAGYAKVRTSETGIESGVGGLAQSVAARPPAANGVVPYILAPDIDATLAAIQRAGGTIEITRTDVFGSREFAHFRDPDGNQIGLWRD